MIHREGPFDQEKLINSLQGYLPLDGEDIHSFDIEYIDDELSKVMVANFVWINGQWIYIDSRAK
jgi:hypothetical protein